MKELKVFVDLAFISAGEEPYAVDSVNYFHTTAIGYAPLIFIADGHKDFTYLMKQIRLVFSNIKDDGKLPQKLVGVLYAFVRLCDKKNKESLELN